MVRRNYKSEYGITLKDAKKLCIDTFGRLPRVGHEFKIREDKVKIYTTNGVYWGSGIQKLYLKNTAGKYHLESHVLL